MEKYTQFRDKSTGISPFMPPTVTRSVRSQAINGVLFLVRFPVMLILIPLLLIPLLNQYVWKWICSVLGISIDLNVETIKRKSDVSKFLPRQGELYVVNHTSPLDLLVMRRLSNKFVILIADGGNIKRVSSWQFALKSVGMSINGKDYTPSNKDTVFLFPEGTTSNGKALVKFDITDSQWKSLSSQFKVKTLAIKMTPSYMCSVMPLVAGEYFFQLLGVPSIHLKLRIGFVQGDTLQYVRDSFDRSGLRSVQLGVQEKEEFKKQFLGR